MKKGTIEIRVCKQTGKKVEMMYVGKDDVENGDNGHKGWMCLHKGEIK